jgi:hypothetical protein
MNDTADTANVIGRPPIAWALAVLAGPALQWIVGMPFMPSWRKSPIRGCRSRRPNEIRTAYESDSLRVRGQKTRLLFLRRRTAAHERTGSTT